MPVMDSRCECGKKKPAEYRQCSACRARESREREHGRITDALRNLTAALAERD